MGLRFGGTFQSLCVMGVALDNLIKERARFSSVRYPLTFYDFPGRHSACRIDTKLLRESTNFKRIYIDDSFQVGLVNRFSK